MQQNFSNDLKVTNAPKLTLNLQNISVMEKYQAVHDLKIFMFLHHTPHTLNKQPQGYSMCLVMDRMVIYKNI